MWENISLGTLGCFFVNIINTKTSILTDSDAKAVKKKSKFSLTENKNFNYDKMYQELQNLKLIYVGNFA